MNVTPNPQCASCMNHYEVFIDGHYPCRVGFHHLCITPEEPFEFNGIVFTSGRNDEIIIDGFEDMLGECEFYVQEK